MADQANASLGAYVPLILSADWWKRYLAGNRNWYLGAGALVLGYVALFLIGVHMNVVGLRGFNWVTGFAIQIAVLIVAGSWMHFVAAGGLGFLAGQPGGERGLSAADGMIKGKEWLGKIFHFILNLSLNAPVAFYAIAIWPVKDAPFLAFIVLAASLSIALAVPLIFQESKFWTKLLWTIHLAIVLFAVSFFSIKAVAPEQSKRLSTWVEAHWSVNPADQARDKATAKIRQARIEATKVCYENLKPDASQADKDRCEALHRTIDGSLLPNIAPIFTHRTLAADHQADGENQAPVSAIAAPAVKTAGACKELVREAEYLPGKQRGPLEMGVLSAGRYQIVVTGIIQQAFLEDASVNQWCPISPNGTLGGCIDANGRPRGNIPGKTWIAPVPPPSFGQPLIAGEAYGAAVIHAFGRPLLVNEKGTYLEVEGETSVMADSNVYQNPENYQATGTRRFRIFKCS